MISNSSSQSTLTQILQEIESYVDLRDRDRQLAVLESNFKEALEGVQKKLTLLVKSTTR